ncbi:MAG TPA: glycosyltransferase family 9 protein [Nitrospiria bacterium]|nr:glycosyltransferase family 9 protein [Nitrospiria bacterium]
MILQRNVLKTIDRLAGGALVRLLGLVTGRPVGEPFSTIRTILVIRPGGMGDAILLIPMLRALKARFPSATIHVLAERRNAEIFGLTTNLVSEVLCYDRIGNFLRALGRRYDAVIDTEQWHRLSAVTARLVRAGRRVGFATNERRRLFSVPVPYDQNRYEAENFLNLMAALTGEPARFDPEQPFLTVGTASMDHPPGEQRERAPKSVLLAPGASYPEKRWGLEKFRQLAEWLVNNGYSVGLIGGPADVQTTAPIADALPVRNFSGRTTLPETARLVAVAGLVIGGDSVALHLAAAFGAPSIALFGPTPPSQWAPRGKRHRTLHHPPPCSPCSRFGHIPPCPYNVDCLNRITVEEVCAAVREIMPPHVLKPPGH